MFQVSEVLRKVPFLAALDERETRFIADRLELKTFEAGDRICRAGDPGDRMYIIVSGKAEVAVGSSVSDREFVIANLGSGDYFGEMALLTGEPRSASVTTTEPSQMYVLMKSDFDVIIERFPSISLSMGKAMSRRLSATLQKAMTGSVDKRGVESTTPPAGIRLAGREIRTAEESRFHDYVAALIAREDLDAYFKIHQADAGTLIEQTTALAERAFTKHEPAVLFEAHKALYLLYEDQVRPAAAGAGNQSNPTLLSVRNTLEKHWERYELGRIGLDAGVVPADPDAFAGYFAELCTKHTMAGHPLFDFLEHRANREDLVAFFLSDAAVIIRFCDLVVLTLVGADQDIRGELADNLWDELGHGRVQEQHIRLFRNLLTYAGIKLPEGPLSVDDFIGNLDWTGLAGYNFYLFLCLNRRNQLRSLGALGAAEGMDPAQYSRVLAGCRRVGFDEVEYYAGHESMDVEHGDHWLRNVLLPLVRKYPDKRHEIVIGALMRINVTLDYYDSLAARFRTGGRNSGSALP